MSIEPITIPMSIEVNDVTIDSTIETNEVTIESTFDAKIEVVEGGDITVQSLTVIQNGTTTAPTGKAYSPVIVNVPNTYTNADEGKVVQNGALVSQTSTTKNANGTYDTTTNNQVTVSVPASAVDTGTKSISTNGTHDVVGYASAAINVPNTYTASDEGKVVDNGVLVAQTSTTVTTNGTYDTTTNDEVVVNVSGGTPTLITKTITENGTYSAEDDDADGYSEVTVNVSGGGGYTVDEIADRTQPSGDITITVAAKSYAFYYSHNIRKVRYLNSALNEPAVFQGSGITVFVAPNMSNTLMNNTFYGCTSLTVADFGPSTPRIGNTYVFRSATNFNTLIVRSNSVALLYSINAFQYTPFDSDGTGGTLYVPQALISSYQSASNWSTILGYANNQIKSIESTHTDPDAPIDLTLYYADGTPIT